MAKGWWDDGEIEPNGKYCKNGPIILKFRNGTVVKADLVRDGGYDSSILQLEIDGEEFMACEHDSPGQPSRSSPTDSNDEGMLVNDDGSLAFGDDQIEWMFIDGDEHAPCMDPFEIQYR